MEGEKGTQHTEADEDEGEEHLLCLHGDVVHLCNLQYVHRCGTAEEIDAEDADDEEGRTTHQHQRELHGCIFLVAATPYTNEQVHGDEGYLVEHEHGEQVGADEEAKHTSGEEGETQEILLGEGLELPRGKGTSEHDDTREQQHHH